ncbi:MAG: hypothetical protein P0Y56_05405 [Candidatus Andeanibacterium colombiense]|uniref:Uncharacterized protein n=1 Tax=Candidatus Andeanibacterium colombiense TaxID=3121345 RepID=A0AAJ5X4R7_9SPHN|nr:MAG: hypothetical protein P0Y56_05405 [Sphingomonadaceae bacterium]
MAEFLAANPWVIGAVVVLALVLVWWLFVANRKTKVTLSKPDVLDEGVAPAKRNQALIDSPSAAKTPGSVLGSAPAPKPAPAPAAAPAPVPAPKPAAKAAPKPKAPAKPKAKAEPKPAVKAAPAPKPVPAPKAKAAPKTEAKAAAKPAAEPKAKAVPKAKAAPKAKAEPKAAPAPKAAPKPKPAPKSVAPDALIQIKGLGPKMEVLLRDLGVTRFAQIAAWSDADIARIDQQLGSFAGRIARDNFVEQAKLLGAGDIAGFEAKFGAL